MAVDEDVVAFADPDRLQDVVMHLLENGIKFSEAGPVTLEAGAAGDVVEISVTDAGQGIEDARLPTVFAGPAPAGGRASPTGSGLGLYLSKRVIEAHGGTIGVRSVPGRTTFTIALPQEGARP
jgi:signal transduction histidine kinase